jgi:hypothetical protein
MFFKRKMPVDAYCETSLKALLSPEREDVYERLRDACADPALRAADRQVYFDHIRAVIIELLNIAIIKSYGLDVSTDARVFIAQYLEGHGLDHIDSLSPGALTSIYNSAFGIPGQDGVASMTAAFSEQVTDSRMREETLQRFYVEFYAILKSLFDELKSIKLVTTR